MALYYNMISFAFPGYLHLEAINRYSLLIFQYLSTSDMQRIMTFHISSASLFLNSKSISACLGCFIPILVRSSVCGWGQGLSALMVWWPCEQALTPLCHLHPHRTPWCAVPGALLLPWVTPFPICPLPGENIIVCSYFLAQAEGELWEQDVEIQQCINERRRK